MFLATKLWPTQYGFHSARDGLRSSLDRLDTDYVDLFMLHWPRCYDNVPWMNCEEEEANLLDEVKQAKPVNLCALFNASYFLLWLCLLISFDGSLLIGFDGSLYIDTYILLFFALIVPTEETNLFAPQLVC